MSSLAEQLFLLLFIQEESKFVFVPGPGDPGPGNVLPRPALPAYFTSDLRQLLPTAVFASNPCRMRLYTQEVVLFRSDLQNHMRRLCLIPPTGELCVIWDVSLPLLLKHDLPVGSASETMLGGTALLYIPDNRLITQLELQHSDKNP